MDELPAELTVKIISNIRAIAAKSPCVYTTGFEVCLLPKTAIKFNNPKIAAAAKIITITVSIIFILYMII